MTQALIYLFASLTIFIISTEAVTFKLSVKDTVSVEIHFIIFALYIKRQEKGGEAAKKRTSRLRPRFRAITAFAQKIIPSSEVEIREMALFIPEGEPSKTALQRVAVISAVSSFLAFAESEAKKFRAYDITFSTSDNTKIKARLDATLTVSLLRLITASAVLLKKHGV